jgi:CheY-like chemotaxis protein
MGLEFTPRGLVLLVEDSASDVYLFREALKEQGVEPPLFVATDGEEAFQLLERIDDSQIPCPKLIVLDLNLPKRSGFEVLSRVRRSFRCRRTPVVILSSSDTGKERELAGSLGVTAYIKKPSRLQEFMEVGKQIRALLLSAAAA